jgi:DNA-binding transcriptional MerR regulator
MKRSGSRRYYRPDDVDLLKGIRRLLYGEGYTIRGVQRILKEHGIASVQRLADSTAVASFGAIEEAIGQSIAEGDDDAAPGIDVDDEDYEGADGIDFRLLETDDEGMPAAFDTGAIPGVTAAPRLLDVGRLESVLLELVTCRQLLDQALKG